MGWSIKASNESRWFSLDFIKQVSPNFVLNENHGTSPLQTYLQLCHKHQDAVVLNHKRAKVFLAASHLRVYRIVYGLYALELSNFITAFPQN